MAGQGIILTDEDIASIMTAAYRKLDAATRLLNQLSLAAKRGDSISGEEDSTITHALEVARELLESARSDLQNADYLQEMRKAVVARTNAPAAIDPEP